MKNAHTIVKEIKEKGLSIVKNYLTPKECRECIEYFEKIYLKRKKNKEYIGSTNYQILENYFIEDPKFLFLIHSKLIKKVMSELIDRDYVLISPSAKNRKIQGSERIREKTSGIGWHNDTRYISKKAIKPSMTYMTTIILENFDKDTGATEYVPHSHLKSVKPKRNGKYKFKQFVAPAGSIIFWDSCLWHRVGKASPKSRWGVFNTYGPWFVKPYHQFYKMFKEKISSKFSPEIRQLLHFDSIPPKDQNERMATLRRVGF